MKVTLQVKKIIRGDKSVKLLPDEHIAVSVIFIENSQGEFLIQKTSNEKGGEYSSTGGHVNSGETPLQAIKREVKEELGVDISNDEIIELGFLCYDFPLRYIFYLRKDIDLHEIKVQEEEVEEVMYMPKNKVEDLIKKELITKSHGIMFEKVIEYKAKK